MNEQSTNDFWKVYSSEDAKKLLWKLYRLSVGSVELDILEPVEKITLYDFCNDLTQYLDRTTFTRPDGKP